MIDYCKKHGVHQDAECQRCIAEMPDEIAHPWFGVAGQDLARVRDFSAYVSLKIEGGIARVKRIYQWPHVKYDIVMQDTLKFYRLDRVRAFAVDITNDAKVGEDYQAMGLQIQPIHFTAPVKNDMIEYYRDVSQKGLLKLPTRGPFVQELRSQLAEQERIQGVTETPKYAHPLGRNDDILWSLMLATRAAAPYLTNPVFAVRIS